MKNILSLNNQKLQDVFIIIYGAILPLGHAMANILLGIIVGHMLIMILNKSYTFSKKNIFLVLIFSVYFFLCLFSLVYSSNLARGFDSIMVKSSLLFLPAYILFFKEDLSISTLQKTLLVFVYSVFFVCCVSFVISFYRVLTAIDVNTISEISGEYFASVFISYHKLYLSLYIVISIYFVNVFFKIKKPLFFPFWSRVIFNLVFFASLLLLASRNQLLIAAVIIGALIVFKIIKTRNYSKFMLLLIFSGVIILINIKYNPVLVEKIKEAINYENQYNIKKRWGGTAVRKLIWEYSYYAIQENFLFGSGIGDAQDVLNLSYENCKESSALKAANYNAHNEVMQILVNIGFIGLLIIVLAKAYLFYWSFTKKNLIYCGFIVVFFISGLTEAYLERDMGVRIFAFFSPILFRLEK